jgi:S-adenosylmethionine:tRNA ribosyltransferase-isomerase
VNASDFDYDLPPDLVAQEPASERAGSRLLHVPTAGAFAHRSFRDVPDLVRDGDLLVLNETRVVPARLFVERASGGRIEVFLVRRHADGWRALLRPRKRLSEGETLVGGGGAFTVLVRSIDAEDALVSLDGLEEAEIFDRFGSVPLPPYVRRAATDEDRTRYQTVFARVPGAVAAPTAGLHFDDALLSAIEARGVRIARLVLHVGPGTFRPLPDGDLAAHRLHAEPYAIPADVWDAVRGTKRAGGRVIAVGTTVVRALEACAAEGDRLAGETDLFILPPYEFRVVDALITNFHLPRSSLLCLVAAFVGRERILDAYRAAIVERYRFYSYGDAMFLEGS